MPPARPVPKGRTLILDRRCTRRFFLLRPDPDRCSQRLFLYCLGVFAAEHGVEIHGLIQMSSHYHLCLTDVRGVLPRFLADMHRTLAACLKEHRSWPEEVWNKSQTSVIDLETPAAVIEGLSYLITNGVEAGMVERPEAFPGAITLPEEIGRWTLSTRRPSLAYLKNGRRWPPVATLRIEMPGMLESEYGGSAARRVLRNAVDRRTEKLRVKRAESGLGFIGADAVCRASVTTVSKKPEKRGRKPTFAIGSGNGRAYRRKVEQVRAWRLSYARCLARWKRGERSLVWPPDTWKMRVVHGAPCSLAA